MIINQPKTAEERICVAKEFLAEYGLPSDGRLMSVVVDDPKANPFGDVYAPWPFRLYGFEEGRIEFLQSLEDCEYNVGSLGAWIENRAGPSSSGK